MKTPEIKDLLEPGEFLQWQGCPQTHWHLNHFSVVKLGFGLLPLLSFAVDCVSSHLSFTPEELLWFLPVLTISGFSIFGDFVDDAIRNYRSYYVVTSRRIILYENGRCHSVRYESLSGVDHWDNLDGTGSIYLRTPGRHYVDFSGFRRPMQMPTYENLIAFHSVNMPRPRHGLYYIEGHTDVYRTIDYNLKYVPQR